MAWGIQSEQGRTEWVGAYRMGPSILNGLSIPGWVPPFPGGFVDSRMVLSISRTVCGLFGLVPQFPGLFVDSLDGSLNFLDGLCIPEICRNPNLLPPSSGELEGDRVRTRTAPARPPRAHMKMGASKARQIAGVRAPVTVTHPCELFHRNWGTGCARRAPVCD